MPFLCLFYFTGNNVNCIDFRYTWCYTIHMKKKFTLRNSFDKYLDDIGSTAASESTAQALSNYLPQPLKLTRQAVANWVNKDSAGEVYFYALLYHAPNTSREYQLAHDLLVANGYIEPVVEVEESSVS